MISQLTAFISAAWVIYNLTRQYWPAIKAACESMEGSEMPGKEKKAAVLAEIKKLPEAAAFPDWMLDTAIQIVFVVEFRITAWMADKARRKEADKAARRALLAMKARERQ